jgi:hypothetical protein
LKQESPPRGQKQPVGDSIRLLKEHLEQDGILNSPYYSPEKENRSYNLTNENGLTPSPVRKGKKKKKKKKKS